MLPFARKTIVVLAFLAPLTANADPIQYIITALPPGVEPLAINNSGAFAGQIVFGGTSQAFVMQPGGPIMGIGPQPGGFVSAGSTVANSINNSGQVAGSITFGPVNCRWLSRPQLWVHLQQRRAPSSWPGQLRRKRGLHQRLGCRRWHGLQLHDEHSLYVL
jgi:hypothetical protein